MVTMHLHGGVWEVCTRSPLGGNIFNVEYSGFFSRRQEGDSRPRVSHGREFAAATPHWAILGQSWKNLGDAVVNFDFRKSYEAEIVDFSLVV